ncbi:UDP-N-acetylglucosamine 2-epimerase [Nonlabens marinus S1-08]|uniref:UDP-N-acetylglucosamine 2-epimerase (non-hydrolyzing) n=2 Tax=Nonlabens TaxID=363408 RepID=W8VXD7_9FLAO|nr:UDP-N-acetylglucosamine 2-epimerase [Nonlabens marinus S1-08]
MVPVIKSFRADDAFETIVCNTAQHREMTDQVLEFFSLKGDYDLDIMQKEQSLNGLMGRLITKLDNVLEEVIPDIVLVHGDTSTCLAATLASFHKQIPVGHVEAGLRTYDFTQPFPEEMNRQVCDKLATLHFAPTDNAVAALLQEGVKSNSIFKTGNTIVDAVELALPMIKNNHPRIQQMDSWLNPSSRLILVTGHRRENFGKALLEVIGALKEISELDNVQLVYPVHLNPNVQDPVYDLLGNIYNLLLCDPLDYESFLWLMKRCDFIITDSGGIQEEATVLGKNVLITRNTTERQEAVTAGFVKLVGTDKGKIVKEAIHLLQQSPQKQDKDNPYGSGDAATQILNAVKTHFIV